jgi:uncharacterized membrane protein (UPF0136 family)
MLAYVPAAWQELRVSRERSPAGGGFLLMLAILIGVAIGAVAGQPSIGLVGGVAVGAIAAIAVWLVDRRKDNA